MIHIPFQHTYVSLPDRFYQSIHPTKVKQPRLFYWNGALAEELGIGWESADREALAAIFVGNVVPEGAEPLAMAYAGHQFGQFVPQLGDGRAILIGEVPHPDGFQRDIQLKGAGRTQFSRGGDGRSPLGPVMREILVSEAMHALGVPSTRALAGVATGEPVHRELAFPGAVLTRVAKAHIRVGTFEFFAARQDVEGLKQLADYTIERLYPALKAQDEPYLALLEEVMERQAELMAHWLSLGFIHGVMNTDNTALSGETIDFGPCAFMEAFDPGKVFSSIDHQGRYAYGNQPGMAYWNLQSLGECLVPLCGSDPKAAWEDLKSILERYPALFERAWKKRMRAKLGLMVPEPEDESLLSDWLEGMRRNEADFTLSFRYLGDSLREGGPTEALKQLFQESDWLYAWFGNWRQRLKLEAKAFGQVADAMDATNPLYIPRNHWVERSIQEAVMQEDFSLFERLMQVWQDPFTAQDGQEQFIAPAAPEERVQRTFCGT